MFITPTDTRRNKVLQAIVQVYIESATAVSSLVVARKLRPRLSAATVRNVMAELDELGLIWQPHTSAGRIPTDVGYRYYIDLLLAQEQLLERERKLIQKRCLLRNEAFDQLLTEILQILSDFSGYTALAFSSGLKRILLKRLELVPLHAKGILVVLISQTGLVKTAVVQLPEEIAQPELAKIVKLLNAEFSGLTLDEIQQRLKRRLLATRDIVYQLLKKALQILELSFISFAKDKLYLEGTSYIVEQPEFQNAEALRAIFKTFEQTDPLLDIMKEDLSPDGIKVHIGKENSCQNIQECSLVISNFKINDKNMGSLGIIGPRRMPYARVIATVNYMAQLLDKRSVDFGIQE
ncbi:heat-inducible transcriptional repressor HrcA [Candidatus Omnitrophota bacterium]